MIHTFNFVLWLANSLVWSVYAHSWTMTIASIAMTAVSFWMRRSYINDLVLLPVRR